MENNLKNKIEEIKSLFVWPDKKPNIVPETNGWFTVASSNVLGMLIQHIDPKIICELGSWTGTGSTRFLLNAAPNAHLLCFDHWSPDVNDHGNGGTTVYEDDDPELLQLPKIWDSFLFNSWEYQDRLTPVRAKTLEGLELTKPYNLPVDLVFIDADHSYKGTYNDIMKCAELWPNSQITGDDFTWETVKAAVIDAAKALNKRVIFCHNCWFLTDQIAFEINF